MHMLIDASVLYPTKSCVDTHCKTRICTASQINSVSKGLHSLQHVIDQNAS